MNELNNATRRFIHEHRADDVRQLALQGCRDHEIDLREALIQIAGWQQARSKLPEWAAIEEVRYPPHLSMEQCSSQLTALYKKEILRRLHHAKDEEPGSLTDLTGGLGIDCSYLAPLFKEVAYIEQQELLCQLAAYNFPLLGITNCHFHHADSVGYLRQMDPVEWIYLDPARRNTQGGKVVAISDCEPDVQQLEPLLLQKARHVLVKLSPMLDLTHALHTLHHVEAAYVVAADGECKELLLLLGHQPAPSPQSVPITCTHLHTNGPCEELTYCKADEQQASLLLTDQPESYLYEPHAALLKAGAFNFLTQRYPVRKLHPNSHLYTSTEALTEFPGRRFRITGWSSFGKKELKRLVDNLANANLTVRNFPLTAEALRKKLKLNDGGPVTLFATTLSNGKHVLIRTEAFRTS